jgi:hypothetical protein
VSLILAHRTDEGPSEEQQRLREGAAAEATAAAAAAKSAAKAAAAARPKLRLWRPTMGPAAATERDGLEPLAGGAKGVQQKQKQDEVKEPGAGAAASGPTDIIKIRARKNPPAPPPSGINLKTGLGGEVHAVEDDTQGHGDGCPGHAGPSVGTAGWIEGSGGYCGATLVVCPVVAVIQWRDEITKYTIPGALKASIHKVFFFSLTLLQFIFFNFGFLFGLCLKHNGDQKAKRPPCLPQHNLSIKKKKTKKNRLLSSTGATAPLTRHS